MRASKDDRSRSIRRTIVGILTLIVSVTIFAATAGAATPKPSPAWTISATSQPTNFIPGAAAKGAFPAYLLVATNVGAEAVSAGAKITDTVPAGLTITRASGKDPASFPCVISGQEVTCTIPAATEPGHTVYVDITIEAGAALTGSVTDEAAVSGGGAASASTTTTTAITPLLANFEFLPGSVGLFDEMGEADGSAADQAGAHPYELTAGVALPSAEVGEKLTLVDQLRDLQVDLPRGIAVNPQATPVRCTEAQLESDLAKVEQPGCPLASQVGVINLGVLVVGTPTGDAEPVYNMVPPPGQPAEFGFDAVNVGIYVHLAGGVATGNGYGLTATASDILSKVPVSAASVTLWGNPSDPSHDYQRGGCAHSLTSFSCEVQSIPATKTPLLTAPTSCSTPLTTTASADSWEEPGNFVHASAPLTSTAGAPISLTGCSNLDFTPSISVTPESSSADSPTGLQVDLRVPQTESFNTLATANLKKAVVTLPAGMTVNPSAANGLAGCSEAEIALNGPEPAKCPDASKIGSVEVTTPLLSDVLKGGVYIAQQGSQPGNGSNPFGSLLAIYMTAEADGALIKLAGHIEANPVTGQLTTTFDENPQLPFEDFKLSFFGGESAALATPATCGQYAASASFASWAQPESPVSPLVRPFALTSGPDGAACPAPGFAPSFTAGTSTNAAGDYSPFVMTLNRKDGEQRLGAVSLKMPKGLVGMISHVTPCSETQANARACPAASQIGHVNVQVGVGGQPDTLPEPGRQEDPVYLTQSYRGAPFGISVVVHAEAGPFNLGTVVVRGTVNVDPHTAQVSIAIDTSGAYAMPTILQGIPVDVKSIDIEVNKSQFMFNPTSCEPMGVAGTIGSVQGANSAVSGRFQAADCAALAFKPSFTVATSAKTSKANGASLNVKLIPPAQGPQDANNREANLHYVKVELPKQLPSRLTTLQKACTAQQFDSNPAGCPSASRVGTAIAHTPLLTNPLTGPAYFVSHGGEAFPQLTLVLQGEGITIDLIGDTFISKAGITSSTFREVPDVPVSSFELTLPQGPYSVLTANGNLCAQPLSMPTEFTGQNGAQLKQNTAIEIEGCSGSIAITKHRIHKRSLTVSIYAPTAGKVRVGAQGMHAKAKTAKGRETITMSINQKHAGRLHTRLRVVFTPTTGKVRKRQVKTLKLRFRR
ncbi:MAG: hypothetical protein ACRDK7_04635 [Solirubrobacteraceae bacterium]